MESFILSNPQAIEAIRLAQAMPHVSRATITQQLKTRGIPRGLFVLACVLRAATKKGI